MTKYNMMEDGDILLDVSTKLLSTRAKLDRAVETLKYLEQTISDSMVRSIVQQLLKEIDECC